VRVSGYSDGRIGGKLKPIIRPKLQLRAVVAEWRLRCIIAPRTHLWFPWQKRILICSFATKHVLAGLNWLLRVVLRLRPLDVVLLGVYRWPDVAAFALPRSRLQVPILVSADVFRARVHKRASLHLRARQFVLARNHRSRLVQSNQQRDRPHAADEKQ